MRRAALGIILVVVLASGGMYLYMSRLPQVHVDSVASLHIRSAVADPSGHALDDAAIYLVDLESTRPVPALVGRTDSNGNLETRRNYFVGRTYSRPRFLFQRFLRNRIRFAAIIVKDTHEPRIIVFPARDVASVTIPVEFRAILAKANTGAESRSSR